MSDYARIANTPTTLKRNEIEDQMSGCVGWHESLLRSYSILKKVKWLLEKGTDRDVILELIDLMESDEFQPYGWHEQRYKEQQEGGEIKTAFNLEQFPEARAGQRDTK